MKPCLPLSSTGWRRTGSRCRPGSSRMCSSVGSTRRGRSGGPCRPPDVLEAFLISFGVIFVAELGDKSQLMALGFATRYRAVPVLIGITIATGLVHLVSVGIGALIGNALPGRAIERCRGVAFIGFARLDAARRHPRERRTRTRSSSRTARSSSPWVGCSCSPSSATRPCSPRSRSRRSTACSARGWARRSAWSPPTRSRSSSDSVAGDRLPERAIRIGAAVLFALIGIASLIEAAIG